LTIRGKNGPKRCAATTWHEEPPANLDEEESAEVQLTKYSDVGLRHQREACKFGQIFETQPLLDERRKAAIAKSDPPF
jgi:hypothetical protein